MNNKLDPKDMDKDLLRIAICDCTTGHFITSMTKSEIEYLHHIVTDFNIQTGDYIENPIAEGAVNIVAELKGYMDERRLK